MREFLHRHFGPGERSLLTLLRWLLVSGLTGVASGRVGAALY